jgi:hypothetical protein
MTVRYVTAAVLRELQVQLTDRDEAVLRRVAGLRFVTGSQLARMHFADTDAAASARAARRALLRLVQLDCLRRLPRQVGGARSGSAGFIYHLGLAGQRLGTQRGWQPARRRRSHVPGTSFVDHALQVAELHTLLVEASHSRRIELLELDAEPACWRNYGEDTLKPDSYARLGIGDFEDSYFIEIDMATEGRRALEGKLRQYVTYEATSQEQAERGVFPKTVWLTLSAKRAADIEGCIERLPHSARELFLVTPFTTWDVTRSVK